MVSRHSERGLESQCLISLKTVQLQTEIKEQGLQDTDRKLEHAFLFHDQLFWYGEGIFDMETIEMRLSQILWIHKQSYNGHE
jgi:hypothetical protein